MSISKLALAIPLSLGIACSTTGANSEHGGAAWPFGLMSDGSLDSDRPARGTGAQVSPPGGVPTGQDGLSVQLASGTEYAAGSSGTTGPSDSSTGSSTSGTGSSGSSGSSSGSSGSMSGSSGTGSQGSTDSPGAAASSDTGPTGADSGSATGSSAGSGGGSSDTMGSGSPSGSSGQGTMGSSDHGHHGGMAGAHAGAQQVMGKISKVSKEEISIKPRSGEAMTLKIRPETMVSINGKDSKPTQLKQGQTVRASYESVDGDEVAVKIEVGKARQAKSGKSRSGHMKGGGAGGGSDHSGHGHGGSMGGSEGGATGGSR